MASDNGQMTFWDHLEELRGTLMRSLAAVLLLTVAGLCFKEFIFGDFILKPLSGDFPIYRWFKLSAPLDIVNLEISGQFMTHLKVSLMLGFVLSFPYIIWELWKFISPALYNNERKSVGRAFLLSSGLFFLGAAIGYFILLPICLAFFQGYTVSDAISNTFSLQSYISMFVSMVLLLGLVFEFPILIMILSNIGVVDRAFLRKGRKYAFVLIMILSAIVTPADLGSMIIVMIPLYCLYEMSIFFCKKEDVAK